MEMSNLQIARRVAVAILLSLWPFAATAQSVQQTGTVTVGHVPVWFFNGVIGDGGTAAQGFLTSLGVTASGPGICQNSGPITGPYQQLCLGVTESGGGTISLQNYGGAPATGLTMIIDGATFQFPFILTGVAGPVSSVAGDLSCWNNTVGTLLADCNVPIQGVSGNVLNTQTSNYTIATGDCSKTVRAGTGSTGFFTITVPSVSGFAGTCVVTILNGDSGRGKYINNDPGCNSTHHILWPGQSCKIGIVNGAWTAIELPGRYIPTGTLQMYADSAFGNDTPGVTDCLAATTAACRTVTRTASLFCEDMDPQSHSVIINIPSGYNQVENVQLCNYLNTGTTATQTNPIITGVNPASSAIAPSSGIALLGVGVATPWIIENLNITSAGNCVEADFGTNLYLAGSVELANCPNGLQILYDSKIETLSSTTVSIGGSFAGAVISTNTGGQYLTQSSVTWACIGNPSFSAFASAGGGKPSGQYFSGVTFSSCSGAVGQRYVATLNSVIDTNGGGATFLPGNSPGSTGSGGQYN